MVVELVVDVLNFSAVLVPILEPKLAEAATCSCCNCYLSTGTCLATSIPALIDAPSITAGIKPGTFKFTG